MNGRADFQEPSAEVPRPITHIGPDYIPTEEERRLFAECNDESFWFRSVPLAATSMLITQGLISKGILSSHPKYGSIPKLIFACIMGYFAGKLSYVKTCQEKFRNLENSPLGEALRLAQARRRSSPPGHYYQKSKYDSNVSGQSSFGTSPAADNIEMLPHYEPIPFSSSVNESAPTGITDHIVQGPDPNLEESPKRKKFTYEELRNKNRESYEVSLTQKTDPSVRPMHERVPKKEVKVNKYGDTWDE
ncbi:OCIA domain-containing protein 1 isoform X1 [Cebus imitator]|uniref:OCIA domain-containing protein 1 n=2 Tax=Cebinae TaxID=38070 RepID=A0A2K5QHH2_CEBIM|nr:OCIA domain-containing protein 1 isoform X1 [Cebus imitator]XP_017395779.1 OCIA domain-containing protein 1 isoform X1 [Cebus imitator]XP_017395780.1 OCIA domain-containing protein 1 isoform X1 [Cebus imitator]XP_017395781.1 OCIA domain-containing protein 1 isoform X1 [Cebus imitator]XP_017395782.1 OCIA domain-containing protein 1 isoform X1 [Cebus imitator]XP_032130029.1 OCIA domain-containing protein 1 isoform X1 [Sapajus apella]XP_032130030.1 OCIA domain-containing protein 1 isoform X1 